MHNSHGFYFCRNCGKVFCYACTDYAAPVPTQQLRTPVRLCCSCFHVLGHDSPVKATSSGILSSAFALGQQFLSWVTHACVENNLHMLYMGDGEIILYTKMYTVYNIYVTKYCRPLRYYSVCTVEPVTCSWNPFWVSSFAQITGFFFFFFTNLSNASDKDMLLILFHWFSHFFVVFFCWRYSLSSQMHWHTC